MSLVLGKSLSVKYREGKELSFEILFIRPEVSVGKEEGNQKSRWQLQKLNESHPHFNVQRAASTG